MGKCSTRASVKMHFYNKGSEKTLFDRDKLPDYIAHSISGSARGCYQEGLIDGIESWSGSSLSGGARQWKRSYMASASSMLKRMQAQLERDGWWARVPLVLLDSRWRRELVLESPRGRLYLWT